MAIRVKMVEACVSHERMRGGNRTVLVLGMATSPAELTETVWALAHQEKAKASLKESLAALTTAQKSLMNSSFAKATEGKGGEKE